MSDPAQYGYRKIYTALGRCPMGTGDLAKSLAEAAFHDAYDLIQYSVHGDGD